VNGALSASCGYGFAGSLHVDFNPAVLRPSFAGLIFRNRLAFAEALSGNAAVGNALFNDIVADRGNAPPPPKPKPKAGDVLFDFDRSNIKPEGSHGRNCGRTWRFENFEIRNIKRSSRSYSTQSVSSKLASNDPAKAISGAAGEMCAGRKQRLRNSGEYSTSG
jgi:hypothetical protein